MVEQNLRMELVSRNPLVVEFCVITNNPEHRILRASLVISEMEMKKNKIGHFRNLFEAKAQHAIYSIVDFIEENNLDKGDFTCLNPSSV